MPTYLISVQPSDFHDGAFAPGIRLSRFRNDPVLSRLAPGRRIQVRRPNGTFTSAKVTELYVEGITKVAYSMADEASLYQFPGDPILRLRFESPITESIAPPGTEIWLVD